MFCKYCGKKIPDNARFCSECGKLLVSSAPQSPPAAQAQAGSPGAGLLSLIPFIVILATYLVWFWLYRVLNACMFYNYAAPLSFEALRFAFHSVPVNTALVQLDWLPCLAAVLILMCLKKIKPRACGWRDAAALACLHTLPLFLIGLAGWIHWHYLGRECTLGLYYMLHAEKNYFRPALWFWAVTLIFLLVRSGSLQITRKKGLICLGVLVVLSIILGLFHTLMLPDVPSDAVQNAVILLGWHSILLWLRGIAALWFAADLGRGRLSLLGSVIFTAVTAAAALGLSILIVIIYALGIIGTAMSISLSYLAGAVVLLIARRRPKKRESIA